MPTTISSGTRPPLAMMLWAWMPTGVCAATAARSISPVESWIMPCLCTSRWACVPLPDPGGARKSISSICAPRLGERLAAHLFFNIKNSANHN